MRSFPFSGVSQRLLVVAVVAAAGLALALSVVAPPPPRPIRHTAPTNRHPRTMRSSCEAVAAIAISNSSISSSGVAIRVNARTFEYEISPRAIDAEIHGNSPRQ